MIYLRPETTKAVEGLGHLSTVSSFARLQLNVQKRWEKQRWVYILFLHTYFINKIANICSI
jgi:hypothetical protein